MTTHDAAAGADLLLQPWKLARHFDVVICDIGLPGPDGYEVLARLRSAAPAAKPCAIALSGYCQAEDRARAIR